MNGILYALTDFKWVTNIIQLFYKTPFSNVPYIPPKFCQTEKHDYTIALHFSPPITQLTHSLVPKKQSNLGFLFKTSLSINIHFGTILSKQSHLMPRKLMTLLCSMMFYYSIIQSNFLLFKQFTRYLLAYSLSENAFIIRTIPSRAILC
jgi:hypothetical protein